MLILLVIYLMTEFVVIVDSYNLIVKINPFMNYAYYLYYVVIYKIIASSLYSYRQNNILVLVYYVYLIEHIPMCDPIISVVYLNHLLKMV
jgi:hypothetical protein